MNSQRRNITSKFTQEEIDQITACDHGYQRKKCPICELIEAERVIKERDAIIVKRDHRIGRMRHDIIGLSRLLKERDATIAQQEKEIESIALQWANANKVIEQRDATIERLRAKVEAADRLAARLDEMYLGPLSEYLLRSYHEAGGGE